MDHNTNVKRKEINKKTTTVPIWERKAVRENRYRLATLSKMSSFQERAVRKEIKKN